MSASSTGISVVRSVGRPYRAAVIGRAGTESRDDSPARNLRDDGLSLLRFKGAAR
jgi:hypothetical protein